MTLKKLLAAALIAGLAGAASACATTPTNDEVMAEPAENAQAENDSDEDRTKPERTFY